MIYYLMEKADWLNTVIFSLAFVAVFVTAHYFVHRLRTGEKPENEVPSLFGHLVGMLYSVLLAFISVSSWANFDNAVKNTAKEVDSLGQLYRISGEFPLEIRNKMQGDIVKYAQLMISSEWPAMQHGGISMQAYDLTSTIVKDANSFEPASISQTNFQQMALQVVNSFIEARRLRLSTNEETIPPMLVAILLIGAVLMIGTTFFVYQSDRFRQLCLTAILSCSIGLLFSLIVEFEYPYRGSLCVPATGWESLLKEIQHAQNHQT